MSENDALIEAVRPLAQQLVRAVDNCQATAVKRILTSLDTQELYAIAVTLAAHVDVPIVEPSRRPRFDVDEVIVRRIIAGDDKLARNATRGEQREVVRRVIESGEPLSILGKRTGWNVWGIRREIQGSEPGREAS